MGELHLQKIANFCSSARGKWCLRRATEFEWFFGPITVEDKTAQMIIEGNAPGSPHAFTLNTVTTAERNKP
jgi:hypothetical protein